VKYTVEHIEGGILAATGFSATGVSAGVKKSGKKDIAIIDAGTPVPAAAVFTRNSMAAAPIEVSRANIESGRIRAAVVNSGNANACTGARGLADARKMVEVTAHALGCSPADVIIASTGVIGVPLPMQVIVDGIKAAVNALPSGCARSAAEAIMTTDTTHKEAAVYVECDGMTFRVGGMAKGSGMIMPNMATMLGFITTDAPLDPDACRAALVSASAETFNRITVDGETSTNDMVLLMASGAGCADVITTQHPVYPAVVDAITQVCRTLAHMIVKDGEGATRFVSVTARGASSLPDADAIARSIANSPLFKTAIFGGDANWGRVAMAVGNSSALIDPNKLEIVFAGITTCREGQAVPFDEAEAAQALAQPEIEVLVDLHLGDCEATVWTCDLSYEYVRINGEYRS